MKKPLLIISYTFPPFPGIGGRRWVKFAKYLNQAGHNIHVIAAQNPFTFESEWTKDAEGIQVHYLPYKYPFVLMGSPKSIYQKIAYRWQLLVLKLSTKGNYFDRSVLWKDQLIDLVESIVNQHGVLNILVSGAPFHNMHHLARLKQKNSNINLIVDFRDFWTDDRSLSALASLSDKRYRFEQSLEREVLNNVDHVLTVSDYMTRVLQSRSRANVQTLENGFDPEDYMGLSLEEKAKGKINFVFTGNLYNNIENLFVPFCMALGKFKNEFPKEYKTLSFDFYGTANEHNKRFVKEQGLDCVKFYGSIPLAKTLEKIKVSDYTLLFLNNTYKFSLSTKFCEYIGLNKPIVLFSEEGETSDYIQKNKLGYWINPQKTYDQLVSLIQLHKHADENVLQESVRQRHNIQTIYKKIETLLI